MVKAFSKEEIDFIRQNYAKTTGAELAKALGRSRGSVLGKAWLLGLSKRGRKLWMDEEIIYVKEHYPKISAKVIAQKLGRTTKSVYHMIERLGISTTGPTSIADSKPLSIDSVEIGRLVGLIDGEGGVYLLKTASRSGLDMFHPILNVTNTDLELLRHLKEVTGFGFIHKCTMRNPKHKQVYIWSVGNARDLYSLLMTVVGHLITKKKAALKVMKALEVKSPHNLLEKTEKLRVLEDIYEDLKLKRGEEIKWRVNCE